MSPLFGHINHWKAAPFQWGQCDCITVLADWVMRNGSEDPLRGIRGTYDGPLSCERQTGFISDPVVVIDQLFGDVGCDRITEPVAGAIAVLRRADDARFPFGAVFTGTHWVSKGPNGATALNPALVEVLAIWGLPDAHR